MKLLAADIYGVNPASAAYNQNFRKPAGRSTDVEANTSLHIDHKMIEGITGGALDADEGEPGPFYIQGDHTGNLKYRNITVSVPKK